MSDMKSLKVELHPDQPGRTPPSILRALLALETAISREHDRSTRPLCLWAASDAEGVTVFSASALSTSGQALLLSSALQGLKHG